MIERVRRFTRKAASKAARAILFRKMNQSDARELLRTVGGILDRRGARWWITDGTLLGCVRENAFISHDLDIDIGVRAEDFDERILDELREAGLEIFNTYGTLNDGFEVTVRSSYLYLPGRSLDIFLFYENDSRLWHATYYEGEQVRYSYPRFGVCRGEFVGVPVGMPDPPTEFLHSKYGPGWRKPDPTWHNYFSSDSLELDRLPEALQREARRVRARSKSDAERTSASR